jgi:transcriptional regulator with XRE-family HTH domain
VVAAAPSSVSRVRGGRKRPPEDLAEAVGPLASPGERAGLGDAEGARRAARSAVAWTPCPHSPSVRADRLFPPNPGGGRLRPPRPHLAPNRSKIMRCSDSRAYAFPMAKRNPPKSPLDHEPRAVNYARVAAGLTKTQLAKACGVSTSLISEIESGTRNATPPMINKLAEALKCPAVLLRRNPASQEGAGERPAVPVLGREDDREGTPAQSSGDPVAVAPGDEITEPARASGVPDKHDARSKRSLEPGPPDLIAVVLRSNPGYQEGAEQQPAVPVLRKADDREGSPAQSSPDSVAVAPSDEITEPAFLDPVPVRISRQLTQRAVARACGVSEKHLARIEWGLEPAPPRLITRLAEFLNCTPAELLDQEAE